MTSVLNVDTIADKAGTGPVGLTKQHAAKQFMLFDQRGSYIGVNTLGESLNTSSVSDDATGNITISLVSNMATANYSPVTTSHYNGLVANKNNARFSGPYTITTSAFAMSICSSNSNASDGLAQTVVNGGLA